MKEVRNSVDNITFGKIPASTLKRWCFILYKTMHMRLSDSVMKLTSLFGKSAKERKPKKEKAEKGGKKTTRGPGKKGGQDFDIGKAILHNISHGNEAEKKVK